MMDGVQKALRVSEIVKETLAKQRDGYDATTDRLSDDAALAIIRYYRKGEAANWEDGFEQWDDSTWDEKRSEARRLQYEKKSAIYGAVEAALSVCTDTVEEIKAEARRTTDEILGLL